ncbi:MAG: glycoside hydrolase family 88 protein [Chromatiales bacterium]|nr:glycoside hydrolase family 88 protein [Chromatiales bacterium]
MIDTSTRRAGPAEPRRVPAERSFEARTPRFERLAGRWEPGSGAPVFTAAGTYTARGWTEWTQGFQFGSPLLVYEATGDPWFLEYGQVVDPASTWPST